MIAEIIPFPSIHRRSLIQKLVLQMASNTPVAAENILRVRLNSIAASLARKGIPSEVISRDLYELQTAARSELSRISRRGGAAR